MRHTLVVLLALASLPASAATVTLAWDPNVESDLAGYKLYYGPVGDPTFGGTNADQGPSPIDVPLASLADTSQPQLALSGLTTCEHIFFAVTAYNTADLESTFSNEVDITLVNKPKPVVVTAGGAGALHVTFDPLDAADPGTVASYQALYDVDAGDPYNGTGAAEGDSPVDVTIDAAAPAFDLTGLPEATDFHVAVVAACSDGTTNESADATGTTGASAGEGEGAAGEGEGAAGEGEGAAGEGEGAAGEGEGAVGEGEGAADEGEGGAGEGEGAREGEGEGEGGGVDGCACASSSAPGLGGFAAALLVVGGVSRRARKLKDRG